MSWEEIQRTPRTILEGILMSLMEYNVLHSMDGYTDKDVGEMAKNKPEVRSHYVRYLEKKRKYYKGAKNTKQVVSRLNIGGIKNVGISRNPFYGWSRFTINFTSRFTI